jgi:hypothetical protein
MQKWSGSLCEGYIDVHVTEEGDGSSFDSVDFNNLAGDGFSGVDCLGTFLMGSESTSFSSLCIGLSSIGGGSTGEVKVS